MCTFRGDVVGSFCPLWSHVEMKTILNLKFHHSLNNFGREPSMSMHEFWGVNLLCAFREDVV